MSIYSNDAPLKISIKDLCYFQKSHQCWLFSYNEKNTLPLKLTKIHIQGEINKTAGFMKEIMIINDGTGKAKVTRGSQVPGDLNWVEEGAHCSVIGHLIENGKLPHISAIKIARITNPVLQEMWPLEVEELKNFILGKVLPKVLKEGNT